MARGAEPGGIDRLGRVSTGLVLQPTSPDSVAIESVPLRPAGRNTTTPPASNNLVLPDPPTDDERMLYRHRRIVPLTIASVLSFSALVVSQVMLVRQSPWLWILLLPFSTTWTYYLVSAVVNIGSRSFNFQTHERIVLAGRVLNYRPSVDVFLPICGESTAVILNTWRHVSNMAQHYPGSVRVCVLDDSKTAELAGEAAAAGFTYFRRPMRGWFKKAGNLRYGYERTEGDLILILDADFAPRADLLDELTPYFVDDKRLGIVQTPQFFRTLPTQGWLERGAGAVQELFYRLIQVSRQYRGAAICVGSCALYRRAALEANGGTTLIEHSEDVHTGFDLRRLGWTLQYVPIPMAAGLCPSVVQSFFAQQYRWCAGSLSLLSSRKFWHTGLAPRARLSYMSGFLYYLHTAVFTVIGPLLPLVLLIGFPQFITLSNYLLVLPSIVYNMVIFPAWHRCRFGIEAWTTKLISGWAHAWAIADTLRGNRMSWVPTGGIRSQAQAGRVWIGIAGWTLPTAAAWVYLAGEHMMLSHSVNFLPMFLMGVFYLSLALQALLVNPERDTGGPVAPRRRRSFPSRHWPRP